jgi:hypothetical protein
LLLVVISAEEQARMLVIQPKSESKALTEIYQVVYIGIRALKGKNHERIDPSRSQKLARAWESAK